VDLLDRASRNHLDVCCLLLATQSRLCDTTFAAAVCSLNLQSCFWSLPCQVWVGNSRLDKQPITLRDCLGWTVWTAGFLIEIVADDQKVLVCAVVRVVL
jgi:hypothetical protein